MQRLTLTSNLERELYLRASFLVCASATLIFILAYYGGITYFLATLLLISCLYPTLQYIARKEEGVPVLPLLCLAYAVEFAIPVFTQEAKVSAFSTILFLDDSDVNDCLLMTIAGVALLQATYHLVKRVNLPKVDLPLNVSKVRIFYAASFTFSFLTSRIDLLFSEDTNQQYGSVLGLLQNQVLVAIAIMGWIVYTQRGTRFDRIALYGGVAIITLIRFRSTTMLEQILLPILILAIAKWTFTRRLPVYAFIGIGAIILFLQPLKGMIRTEIREGEDVPVVWTEKSAQYWEDSLSGRRNLIESTSEATSRTDLIHQFTHIYSMTPDPVPYQMGGSYLYFLYAPVPRAVWPEKPESMTSNNFFAVNYGISTEEGIKHASFGVSLIGEGFMNFGVAGALMIMVLQGFILGLLERVFANSPGGMAIFIVNFAGLLNGIGSSASMMFGAMIQNLLASCLLLLWASKVGLPKIRL